MELSLRQRQESPKFILLNCRKKFSVDLTMTHNKPRLILRRKLLQRGKRTRIRPNPKVHQCRTSQVLTDNPQQTQTQALETLAQLVADQGRRLGIRLYCTHFQSSADRPRCQEIPLHRTHSLRTSPCTNRRLPHRPQSTTKRKRTNNGP